MHSPLTFRKSVVLSIIGALTLGGSLYGQSSPVQNSLTIQGSAGTPYNWPTIYLDKDNSSNPPGLWFSYSEDSNGNGTGIQFLNKASGQWQWQLLPQSPTEQYPSQLQMTLDANNRLTLYDLSNPTANPVIVIDPHGATPGITINGQPVVTFSGGQSTFVLWLPSARVAWVPPRLRL